jgi:hypothetical protein
MPEVETYGNKEEYDKKKWEGYLLISLMLLLLAICFWSMHVAKKYEELLFMYNNITQNSFCIPLS